MANNNPKSVDEGNSESKFLSLFVRYCDGAMDETELAQFGKLVRENEQARKDFVFHVLQDTLFFEMFANDEKDLANIESELESPVTNCSANAESSSHLYPATDVPLIGELTGPLSPQPNPESHLTGNQTPFTSLQYLQWGIGGLLLTLLLFGVYQLGINSNHNLPVTDAHHTDKSGSELRVGTGPLEVRSLHVDSGTSKFYLANIGYVIAEGPTDFEMIGPMCARLNKGRIKVRVTEDSGRGFVIITPSGKVTDLGTEYDLNVTSEGRSNLVIREGSVDLQVTHVNQAADEMSSERLVQGEGVTFDKLGNLDRIMAIVKGKTTAFHTTEEVSAEVAGPAILKVSDTLRSTDTKKFYEIIPGGLQEDALAFVDRPHEWNGVSETGLPQYLLGADYVKTFNDDKMNNDVEIKVTLNCPSKLYVFYDMRLKPPEWLVKDFRKTGDLIGLDMGHFRESSIHKTSVGAGDSVDHRYEIYEQIVSVPGEVTLGSNRGDSKWSGMYGIAAVPLEVK